MKIGWDQKVIASTHLWLDHTICQDGSGFQNSSGYFYPIYNTQNDLFAYAAPYKPLIADTSVSGATIMTGVYLNGALAGTGTSGIQAINYDEGLVYFTSAQATTTTISGNFAVKEFQVSITDKSEEQILFETKYEIKGKITQTLSGLQENQATYPIIYIKNNGGHNEPWSFGGTDQTITNVRLMVLAESQWQLDGITSFIKDRVRCFIPIVEPSEVPFNALGGTQLGGYNYTTLTASKIPVNTVWIDDVTHLSFDRASTLMAEFKKINPKVWPAMLDMRLMGYRNPRAA